MPVRRPYLACSSLLAILLGSCSGDSTGNADRGVQIEISGGDQQAGTVGSDLPQQIQVTVTDLLDEPISGQVVNFVVLAGGGDVTRTAHTNASGQATGTWELGTVAGSAQQVEARTLAANGTRLTVTFTATAAADAPDTIAAVTAVQLSAAAGTAVRTIPTVRLSDQYGNVVPNQAVTFAVTGGGGSVQGGAATSDSSGLATILSWTLGAAQGPNQLSATVAGLPAILFNATGTSPIATQVGFAVEPASIAQSGTVLTRQPVAQLLNDAGDPIPTPAVTVTASIASGTGILIGDAQVVTDATGAAAFTDLAIGGTVGNFTLELSAPALAEDTSALVALAAGPPTTFSISAGDGQSVNAGSVLPVDPQLTVSDDWGNGVSGIGVGFTVASGGGSLTGGNVVTDGNGNATLGSWTLGPLPDTNSLTATANRQGLTGNPQTVTAIGLGDFWKQAASMTTPRRFAATASANGLLYTAGGKDVNLVTVATVEVYLPQFDLWTPRANMGTARVGAAAGWIGDKLYVAGGTLTNNHATATAEAFAANNTWSSIASMPMPRNFSAYGVLNDKLILAGGGDDNGQLQSVIQYDPVTNAWDTLASLPTVRNDAVGVVLNGLFYMIGGKINNATDGALFVYDPQADSWTELAPMPTPRFHVNAEAANGKIYVISGLAPAGSALPIVEVYDPATDTWDTAADVPLPRTAGSIGNIDGLIYLAGGSDNNVVTGQMDVYVPQP